LSWLFRLLFVVTVDDLENFEEYQSSIFEEHQWRMPLQNVSHVLLMGFQEEDHRGKLSFSSNTINNTYCKHDTLFTWLTVTLIT
jgi:hypothetical protein